jgi:hypothetical protein
MRNRREHPGHWMSMPRLLLRTRRPRRLVVPAFSPRRLEAYTEGFSERTEAHVGQWSEGTVLEATGKGEGAGDESGARRTE